MMNQAQPVPEFREVEIQCSVCGKCFISKVFLDKTYKGGNYFGNISAKGKKFEYWECDK
jgi:hypothetical protein